MIMRLWCAAAVLVVAGCESVEVAEVTTPDSNGHTDIETVASLPELEAFNSFDFDFTLTSVEGEQISLADYKGKVLIVDMWGTWCPPCRDEIPHFIQLLEKHNEAGLAIVGINYERGDPANWADVIKTFVEKFGVTYPCLIGDTETKNMAGLTAYPTTLFIDHTGKIRLKIVGYSEYDHLESIVEALLAEQNTSDEGA